jgi:ribosomal protein S27AE
VYHELKIMKTKKKSQECQNCSLFLVLVPHRDTRVELGKYFETRVKAGLCGVYPFPFAAPLASLSKPLTADELKQIAHSLRQAAGESKFICAETSSTSFQIDSGMILFGPKILINTDFLSQKHIKTSKIKSFFSTLIIGTWLKLLQGSASKENKQLLCEPDAANQKGDAPLQNLAFRAAAVANMYWQPFSEDGEVAFKWKIGKLLWLPKADKAAKGRQGCQRQGALAPK